MANGTIKNPGMEKWDLLWENASPESVFAAQNVTVSGISNYDFLFFTFKGQNGQALSSNVVRCVEGFGPYAVTSHTGNACYRRYALINANDVVYFSAVSENVNQLLIPQQIYGIKGVIT